jgi:RNA polymerase sigma-70 factor, ECF subfamily
MAPDLEHALLLARDGEEAGFSGIYARLAGPVNRFLAGRGAWDSEGLTNEVFLSAFRSLETFEGDAGRLQAWIFTIARNKAIDDARARARRPVAIDMTIPEVAGPDSTDEVFSRLGAEWVKEQLASLTEDQRDVLVLRLVEDLTIREISEITGKPVDAVKALQRRALRRLAKKISADPYPLARDRR